MRIVAILLLCMMASAGLAAGKPKELRIAVHVNDIQQISLKTHSFYADLYIGLRWSDPEWRPSETLTWMNPFQLWAHITRTMTGDPQRLTDGSLFEWIRVRGEFNVALALQDYPLDRQVLVAEFEDRALNASRMVHVGEAISLAPDLDVPGFLIGQPRLVVSQTAGIGAVQSLSEEGSSSFSRMRIEIPVSRPFVVYLTKLGLPLLIMTACAALVFMLPPEQTEARVGLGITSLLVIVALHITLNTELPEINYLTRLDKAYLVSYLFGFGSLVSVIWITRRHLHNLSGSAARRTNRRCGTAMCGSYLALMAYLVLSTGG
jgi:gamma-aminobutyric acid receptor subunit theta